jgi:hypothetical protein
MPAYFIAEIDVQDAAAFEDYRRQVPAAIARYGGRYLVRGGGAETLEGDWQPARVVVAGASEPGAGTGILRFARVRAPEGPAPARDAVQAAPAGRRAAAGLDIATTSPLE